MGTRIVGGLGSVETKLEPRSWDAVHGNSNINRDVSRRLWPKSPCIVYDGESPRDNGSLSVQRHFGSQGSSRLQEYLSFNLIFCFLWSN